MVDFLKTTILFLLQVAVCDASYYCYYSYSHNGYVCNMSSGTIVGSAIGSIISLAFLVLICCCIGYRRRQQGTIIRSPAQRVTGVTVCSTTTHTPAPQNYYPPQYQTGYNNPGFSPPYAAQPQYPMPQPYQPQMAPQPAGYQSPPPTDAPPSYESIQKY